MTDLESSTKLKHDYEQVLADIKSACESCQRPMESVQLLAVSKKHSIEAIEAVHGFGQSCFGENYVQEGTDKAQVLSGLKLDWHFIGPIQSNKTKHVAEHFHWVHTIEREKIAQRLNDQRPEALPPLNVLIQVNISEQESKSGIHLNEVTSLANKIMAMPNLKLRGLMCIPAPNNENQLRQEFLSMGDCFQALQQANPDENIDTLSMGMSADLSLAIECGSTMVRIGTAIFGQRLS